MRFSKRGSYIMEAAIVMPVTILAVLTVILIVMFFYRQVEDQSELHMALRSSAGAMTGKTICAQESRWTGQIQQNKGALGGTVSGKGYVMMRHRGLLRRSGPDAVEGTYYATDGPKYVRYCSLVKEQLTDEEQ